MDDLAGNTKLRCLSLFSGIGGVDLGLKRIAKTVCYCEIDPYACGVLIKNMAKGHLDVAPIWSDVTTFGQSELAAIGPIDIIAGGFPCQDISCAGKGEGIQRGNRSGLFYEIIRLIRLARPKYVFLENVPALLVRGMDTVLRELSESGYDVSWQTLSAAEVGANHKRERVWIMAHARCQPEGGEIRRLSNQCEQSQTEIVGTGKGNRFADGGKNAPHTQGQRPQGQRTCGQQEPQIHDEKAISVCDSKRTGQADWSVEPNVGRVASRVPFRVDRLRCLGNAVVPQCIQYLFSEEK